MRTYLIPLSALSLFLPAAAAFAQSTSSSSSMNSVSSMSSSVSSSPGSTASRTSSVSSVPSASSASAITYNASAISRYTDTNGWDKPTSVSVSVLTQAGVLQGDPSGTFRAQATLNRAEFMQIAMRLLPPSNGPAFTHCFPDVASDVWYAQPVCRAKELGIVRGNVIASLSADQWPFQPDRNVNYEEAVKVLDKIYALPLPSAETNGPDWYVTYINAAHEKGLDLSGLVAGDQITRGEMAQLTANFYAYATGNLNLLQAAEGLKASSSSSRMSSASSASSTSVLSSSGSAIFDQLTDRSVQPDILLLGQTSQILAGAKFFSNNEPLDVSSLTINLAQPVQSVDSFLVYDGSGRYLGQASQVSGSQTSYTVSLAPGKYSFGKQIDSTVYVRARLKAYDSGGVSGELVQVANIQLNGTGQWSNDNYASTSSDVYPISETARGEITAVSNSGSTSQLFTAGTDQLLGQFHFDATTTDAQADVRLTKLVFQDSATSGVTLSNVQLRVDGTDTTSSCSVSSNIITCDSIPTAIGRVDGSKTIDVYGDVALASGTTNPSMQLVISQSGNTATPGDVTWTDGTTTFTWFPHTTPVVRGTQFQ